MMEFALQLVATVCLRAFQSCAPETLGALVGSDEFALLHTRRGSVASGGVKFYNLSGFL